MKTVYVTIARSDLRPRNCKDTHNVFYFPANLIKEIKYKEVHINHFMYEEDPESDELELLEELLEYYETSTVIVTVHPKEYERFKAFINTELEKAQGINVEYIEFPPYFAQQSRRNIFIYYPDMSGGVLISSFYKRKRVYRKVSAVKIDYEINLN